MNGGVYARVGWKKKGSISGGSTCELEGGKDVSNGDGKAV